MTGRTFDGATGRLEEETPPPNYEAPQWNFNDVQHAVNNTAVALGAIATPVKWFLVGTFVLAGVIYLCKRVK